MKRAVNAPNSSRILWHALPKAETRASASIAWSVVNFHLREELLGTLGAEHAPANSQRSAVCQYIWVACFYEQPRLEHVEQAQ